MKNFISLIILLLIFSQALFAQTESNTSIPIQRLTTRSGTYYQIPYKLGKPDDVPQEIFDALWEIQIEVINNFTYDYAVLRGEKKNSIYVHA